MEPPGRYTPVGDGPFYREIRGPPRNTHRRTRISPDRSIRATTASSEKEHGMAIEVAKVELKTVQDGSGLEACVKSGQFSADEVVAVIGKTEGNGGVNDFTRILADH